MDYIDDDYDTQPRARLLPSRSTTTSSSSSPASASLSHVAACIAAAVLLLFASYYLLPGSQVLASVLLWFASSLVLAPFAPCSSTGGDISVGRGRLLLPQEPLQEPTTDHIPSSRRPRRHNPTPPPQRSSDPVPRSPQPPPLPIQDVATMAEDVSDGGEREEDVGEWTDRELEVLRRQMVKHPAGEPQRWEKIAAAFGSRRSQESVIRAAKSGGSAAGDSFEQFLRRRKPHDPRAEAPIVGGAAEGGEAAEASWSTGDDLALLNALKAFPKDVPMRWEKVAAAVPGKTKAACMKRVSELKRDYRSSKVSSEVAA